MDDLYNLLRDYSLEEILEMSNISNEEVLEALFDMGYTFLVPRGVDYGYIEQNSTEEEEQDY